MFGKSFHKRLVFKQAIKYKKSGYKCIIKLKKSRKVA